MNAEYAVTISQMNRLSNNEMVYVLSNLGYISHVKGRHVVLTWRDQVPLSRDLLKGMLIAAFKHDHNEVANVVASVKDSPILSGHSPPSGGHRTHDFRPIATGRR